MPPFAFHVTFRLADSRVIAPDAAAQRRAARAVLAAARPFELLAFRIADTHGHLELVGDEGAVREATRRILIAISKALRLPVRFDRPRLEPIFDQFHLDNTFAYILRQADHHGFAHDPFHDGSNLPDLLGLRTLGAWTADRVRARLPRIDRAALLGHLGAPDLDGRPLDLSLLPDAAAAALALPQLSGRSAPVSAARTAAVHLASDLPTTRLADLLGVSPRAIRQHRDRQPDLPLRTAIAGQLRLRARPPASPLA